MTLCKSAEHLDEELKGRGDVDGNGLLRPLEEEAVDLDGCGEVGARVDGELRVRRRRRECVGFDCGEPVLHGDNEHGNEHVQRVREEEVHHAAERLHQSDERVQIHCVVLLGVTPRPHDHLVHALGQCVPDVVHGHSVQHHHVQRRHDAQPAGGRREAHVGLYARIDGRDQLVLR